MRVIWREGLPIFQCTRNAQRAALVGLQNGKSPGFDSSRSIYLAKNTIKCKKWLTEVSQPQRTGARWNRKDHFPKL